MCKLLFFFYGEVKVVMMGGRGLVSIVKTPLLDGLKVVEAESSLFRVTPVWDLILSLNSEHS